MRRRFGGLQTGGGIRPPQLAVWRDLDFIPDFPETYARSGSLPLELGICGSAVGEIEMIAEPKHKPHHDDNYRGKRRRQEKALDEALKNTFPASDPTSSRC